MNLNIRILRTDGSVTRTVERSDCRKPTTALLDIGSRLRASDPTVAAVRADEVAEAGILPQFTWIGHHTDDHIAVIAANDRTPW